MPRWLQSATAFGLYLTVSICYFGLSILPDPSGRFIGVGADPTIYMWCLVWWPHAIAERINPFLTKVIGAPAGFNLAWGLTMPGPSLVFAPVTHWFGPVFAVNLIGLTAPALAAWSAFLLCKYLSNQFWPSIVGGYVFGFSSYMLGQMMSHLPLTIVFSIPLLALLFLRRFDRDISFTRFVFFSTALLALTFLDSTEMFASATLFAGMAVLLALLILPPPYGLRLWQTVADLVIAYTLTAAIISPYLYYALVGPEPLPFSSSFIFSNDLLSLVVPTRATLIGHDWFAEISHRFSGNLSENGGYLGLPSIAVVVLFALRYWRMPRAKFLTGAFLLVWICSLGPRLHVGGRPGLKLPWELLAKLPLIDQALPVRFTMSVSLVTSIMVAMYLASDDTEPRVRITIGAIIVAFLLPNLPLFLRLSSPVETPSFFSSGQYKQYIAKDENILVLPFGSSGSSMLWQAQTHMYFRMAGGYVGVPPPEMSRWAALTRTLQSGHSGAGFEEELRPFLASNGATAIVVGGRHQETWRMLLSNLGVDPISVGSVLLFKIPPGSFAPWASTRAADIEGPLNLSWYSVLIVAAHRFVAAGLPRESLSLGALGPHQLAPPSTADGPYMSVEPWGANDVSVTITGFYDALEPIVRRFMLCASKISYPRGPGGRPRANVNGLLRMVFDPHGLECAATLAASP